MRVVCSLVILGVWVLARILIGNVDILDEAARLQEERDLERGYSYSS